MNWPRNNTLHAEKTTNRLQNKAGKGLSYLLGELSSEVRVDSVVTQLEADLAERVGCADKRLRCQKYWGETLIS